MKREALCEVLGEISEEYVLEADAVRSAQARPARRRWIGAAAAVLAVAILGGVALSRRAKPAGTSGSTSPVIEWSESMPAADYFKYNQAPSGGASGSSGSLVMPPYAAALSLDDRRAALEAEGVLPVVVDHPEQSFQAEFHGDGSLYKVWFLWMRRSEGSLSGYSDLKLTAAPREVHELGDTVAVALDADGRVIEPNVTVTRRDGVHIVARGYAAGSKTLTWQTAQGWYQLSGSARDGFEDLVALLDWFWDHPLDLDRFAALSAETVTLSARAEHPEAFAGQIPDFSALGYSAERERVAIASQPQFSDGPVWFEGVYARGDARVRWTVSTGADRDAWDACLGRPNEISEQDLNTALKEKDFFTVFFDGPCMATLELLQGTPDDAWEIIQTLQ